MVFATIHICKNKVKVDIFTGKGNKVKNQYTGLIGILNGDDIDIHEDDLKGGFVLNLLGENHQLLNVEDYKIDYRYDK